MPVRVAPLATSAPAAGVSTVIFTVPAGQTWIVKNVMLWNGGAGADTVRAYANDAVGNAAVFMFDAALAGVTRQEFSTGLVMGPGATFTVRSLNATTQFWVSGTKLPGVA